MNDELKLGLHIRQVLDQGCLQLDSQLVARLREARTAALARQQLAAEGRLSLAGSLQIGMEKALPHLRTVAALGALMMGMVGSYYWNSFEDAEANEEIDSALLAADLPVDAYTDQGFHAWLNHSSQD
ncbi:DUF3619 family protein [Denitratisoma oestradiolicum]|uniref:DUF3619 domain-containing protein n=1 Tax=Denitratisoma oestradiolicum TaxID=311182 RepID=A0A6S6Y0C3_9PROT|nr:DUF3619 family protein [Denitratisoma oestradiolicum]TWO81423.1 hypothetical protein CBW56_04750 [Denitratisoma oestradiolicum]CAB1368622.1 conserved protein of unknown function [Denitratisoma oestradiolicum]